MITKGTSRTIKARVVKHLGEGKLVFKHPASGKLVSQDVAGAGAGKWSLRQSGRLGPSASVPPVTGKSAEKQGKTAQALSSSKLAAQAFARRVVQLPGVLRVEEYEETASSAVRRFLVVVPTLNSRTSELVLGLKNELLDQYAGARLEVRLKGVQERGLGLQDAHLVS